MSDAEPFLRAIREQPEEDGPRLVYADWLDERGEAARAEFIRVQCERTRLVWDVELGRCPTDGRVRELFDRQEALLLRHEAAWRAELPDLAAVEWGRFERGFVGAVTVRDAGALRRHAARVFSAAPVCGLVFERLTGQQLRALEGLPELARVTALNATQSLGRGTLEVLLAAADWARLTSLFLSNNPLSAADVQALAAAPLPALRILGLSCVGLDLRRLMQLTRAPWFPRLARLYLTENGLLDRGALALAQAELSGLELLALSWNQIGDPGGRALAVSPRLANLRRLDLTGNPIRESRERLWARFGDRVRL